MDLGGIDSPPTLTIQTKTGPSGRFWRFRAEDEIRTRDLLLGKETLYQAEPLPRRSRYCSQRSAAASTPEQVFHQLGPGGVVLGVLVGGGAAGDGVPHGERLLVGGAGVALVDHDVVHLGAEQEVAEQHGRIRTWGVLGQRGAAGAGRDGLEGYPVGGRALLLEGAHLVSVRAG